MIAEIQIRVNLTEPQISIEQANSILQSSKDKALKMIQESVQNGEILIYKGVKADEISMVASITGMYIEHLQI